MTLPAVPVIRGLREIVDDYDALLLDQWGVLHGGVEPYPGVLETLAALRSAGKPAAVLSNAPRRSHHAEGRLHQIGVPRNAYDRLVTSGDAAHAALAARDDPAHGGRLVGRAGGCDGDRGDDRPARRRRRRGASSGWSRRGRRTS